MGPKRRVRWRYARWIGGGALGVAIALQSGSHVPTGSCENSARAMTTSRPECWAPSSELAQKVVLSAEVARGKVTLIGGSLSGSALISTNSHLWLAGGCFRLLPSCTRPRSAAPRAVTGDRTSVCWTGIPGLCTRLPAGLCRFPTLATRPPRSPRPPPRQERSAAAGV
jgi:hypothetical protein